MIQTPTRILVPTDFLSGGRAALSAAIAVAKNTGAEILLTHVIEPSVPAYDEELGVLEPEVLRTKLQVLATARKYALPISAQMRFGDPATEIIRLAKQERVDLIIMGTRGHSRLPHLLVGSVAAAVLRRAPCTVITVHLGVTRNECPSDALELAEFPEPIN